MPTFEQEDLYRAAGALKNDKACSEVLRRLEEKYIDAWRSSSAQDYDTRDDAYRMVRAIYELRGELNALASEPSVAAFNRRLRSA